MECMQLIIITSISIKRSTNNSTFIVSQKPLENITLVAFIVGITRKNKSYGGLYHEEDKRKY